MAVPLVPRFDLGYIPALNLRDAAQEPTGLHDHKCLCGECGGGMRLRTWSGEQLLAAALIESALTDALRLKGGIPTVFAKWARAWLAADPLDPINGTEWEKVHYLGSFQWCADALSPDGFNFGRPLRPIADWQQEWLSRIDAVWTAAARASSQPRRPCFARTLRRTACSQTALPGSLFCKEHQAARPRLASAPTEPPEIQEAHPPASAALAGPCAGRTPSPAEDCDLPPLECGEAYINYWRFCTQIAGVTPTAPERWGVLAGG